jgi:hypothetical protein
MENQQPRLLKKSYIEPRVNIMTQWQSTLFIGVLGTIIFVLGISSILSVDMYVYSDGETYSCPSDKSSERGSKIMEASSFLPRI